MGKKEINSYLTRLEPLLAMRIRGLYLILLPVCGKRNLLCFQLSTSVGGLCIIRCLLQLRVVVVGADYLC